jgi:hypothetical protein
MRHTRLLAALACALALPGTARASYGWPLKPFDRAHPIRGYFNDPRRDFVGDELQSAFHFGIDISAHDGTPVYSVAPGLVSRHAHYVTVTGARSDFGYWHIDPVVRQGQSVARGTLLGTIQTAWGHVHFAESVNGIYLNPLRPGALAPYRDRTPPVVNSLGIGLAGKPVDPTRVSGPVDLTCDAYDVPPLAPLVPWQHTRVTPALVRWRLVRPTFRFFAPESVVPWQTAADFRFALLPGSLFNLVYAPGTRQNRATRPGRYNFYLAQAWPSSRVPDGLYRLEVAVSDERGNTTNRSLPLTIANGAR